MTKTVLNTSHEGSDSWLTLKLGPGSSKEFNHREIAEADVDFLGRQRLFTVLQNDRATERIVGLLMQLKIRHEFNFRDLKRTSHLIKKIFQ